MPVASTSRKRSVADGSHSDRHHPASPISGNASPSASGSTDTLADRITAGAAASARWRTSSPLLPPNKAGLLKPGKAATLSPGSAWQTGLEVSGNDP